MKKKCYFSGINLVLWRLHILEKRRIFRNENFKCWNNLEKKIIVFTSILFVVVSLSKCFLKRKISITRNKLCVYEPKTVQTANHFKWITNEPLSIIMRTKLKYLSWNNGFFQWKVKDREKKELHKEQIWLKLCKLQYIYILNNHRQLEWAFDSSTTNDSHGKKRFTCR